MPRFGLAAALLCGLIGTAAAQQPEAAVKTGAAAFGGFRDDSPGTLRHIRPGDLPRPGATPSSGSRSSLAPPPQGAEPKTMPGFSIGRFATGLDGARVIRVAPNGDVFVAQSDSGRVSVLRPSADQARADAREVFAQGLRGPFGIAFHPPGASPTHVFVAETHRVVRYAYAAGDLKARGSAEVVVSGLPTGGHGTRDIAFSPDGRTLFVSVGSQSNVAENLGAPPDLPAWERTHGVGAAWGREEWRASVLAFDADGQNRRAFANGIRNCSGLAVQPGTGALFCATNERDLLGDNLPPDYVTRVREGGFYGWPWFYLGPNQDPRHPGARGDLKDRVIVPDVLIQAHSAPLGVAFNPGGQFPDAMTGDAFVALHGSWNRSLMTGYKIVRLPFRDGVATGQYQDFVTGFVTGELVWGRPVSVAFAKDGSLLFSEDANGTVYRVSAQKR